jgi:hypothetical protein
MKNEFVPYDITLAMEELGFDEECFGYFTDDTKEFRYPYGVSDFGKLKAPLYQQAFRWFREKYNIDCRFHTYTHFKEGVRTDFMWDYIDGNKTSFDGHENTYKEAQDACLRQLIEIVKEKQDENN